MSIIPTKRFYKCIQLHIMKNYGTFEKSIKRHHSPRCRPVITLNDISGGIKEITRQISVHISWEHLVISVHPVGNLSR